MVDGKSFKESLQEEKLKWSGMNWKQRYDYFKSYYLVPTVIVIALLIAAINIIHTVRLNKREMLLCGDFVNVKADDSLYSKLEDEYFAYLGGDAKKQQIQIVTDKVLNLDPNSMSQTDIYSEMAIIGEISANTLDYMFLDEAAFQRWTSFEAYADLNQYLSEEQLAKFANALTDVTTEEGEIYPGGICINQTDLMEKYNISSVSGGNVYLVIICTGPNVDNTQQLIDYLFQ